MISGTGIRVTPQQLAGVAAQLTSGAANVEATLAQLANAVAPLGSDWAGTAQDRFQALWAQWQRDARGLQQALTGISQLMSKASTGYDEAEQAIAASFNV
jgi:WXG100 family type VII secretion target